MAEYVSLPFCAEFREQPSLVFGSDQASHQLRGALDRLKTIKQAVMAGLGVAVISAHTIAAEVKQRRMKVLLVTGLPIVCKWYVLRAKAKHLLPAGIALWEFLVQHSGRYAPDVLATVGHSTPTTLSGRH